VEPDDHGRELWVIERLRRALRIGSTKYIDKIEIRWPSGAVQVLQNVKADQILEVHEPKA